jgi:hypothetical protein
LLAATMKFNAEAAASTFSQFSAAKLFGLFENSFEQPNHNITPQEVKKTENNNIGLGAALGNFNLPFFFGNNANMLPLATVGGTTMPTAATTPIDQLLQISQQISTDSKKRPQMNNQSIGGRRSRGAAAAATANDNNGTNAGGKQYSEIGGGGERKRVCFAINLYLYCTD